MAPIEDVLARIETLIHPSRSRLLEHQATNLGVGRSNRRARHYLSEIIALSSALACRASSCLVRGSNMEADNQEFLIWVRC